MIQPILAALPELIAADFLQRLDRCDLAESEAAALLAVRSIVQEMQAELSLDTELNRLIRFALSLAPEAVVQAVFSSRGS